MDLTGQPDGEPMRGGVAFADVMTGIYSALAITAALNERHTTGKGSYIDMALLDTQVARARQSGLELSGQRQGAEAHGQRASGRRALSGVSGGRRPRHHRVRQRHPVRAADRAARRARDGAGRALQDQCGTRGQSRHADPAHDRADREDSRAPTCWRSSKPRACRAGRSTRWKTCSPTRRCWRARCASTCRASSPRAARSPACARRSRSTACAWPPTARRRRSGEHTAGGAAGDRGGVKPQPEHFLVHRVFLVRRAVEHAENVLRRSRSPCGPSTRPITPAMCADTMVFGSLSSGLSAGVGSASNTSMPAPASLPAESAACSAFSSMMPPRAVLMM